MEERTYSEKLDTKWEDDAVCPYCEYRDESAHEHMDDTDGDGDHTDVWCAECGRKYQLTFNITLTFTTERMEEV